VSSSAFASIIEKYFYRNGGWKRLKGELAVYRSSPLPRWTIIPANGDSSLSTANFINDS
jgi:hypothetical protein